MADNVTTQELEDALIKLAEAQGKSVVEYVQSLGYSTVEDMTKAIAGLNTKIDAITEMDSKNDAVSLAEKIKALNEAFTSEEGVVNDILTKVEDNRKALDSNVEKIEAVNNELISKSELASRNIKDVEDDIHTLNADVNTVGSVARAIQDATGGNISDLKGRVEVTEKTLSDAVDSDGNVTAKGIVSRVAEVEGLMLDMSQISISTINNAFRKGMGFNVSTDGSVI